MSADTKRRAILRVGAGLGLVAIAGSMLASQFQAATAPAAQSGISENALVDSRFTPLPSDIVFQKVGNGQQITMLTLVSLGCSHCRAWEENYMPAFLEGPVQRGNLRLVLRDYPLDSPSLVGAAVLAAMPREKAYKTRQDILKAGGIQPWVDQLGPIPPDSEEARAVAVISDDEAVKAFAEQVRKTGETYRPKGTPTFIIGRDVKLGGMTLQDFSRMTGWKA